MPTKKPTTNTIKDDIHSGSDNVDLSRKRLRVFVIITVCVLLIGLFIAVFINYRQRSAEEARQAETQKIRSQLSQDIGSGNFDKSISALKQAPKTEENQLILISAYLNQGDFKSALEEYKYSIKNYGANLGLIEGAASAAAAANNPKQAIEYYKQAKKIAEKQPSAVQKAEIARYEALIKALEMKR